MTETIKDDHCQDFRSQNCGVRLIIVRAGRSNIAGAKTEPQACARTSKRRSYVDRAAFNLHTSLDRAILRRAHSLSPPSNDLL